VFQINYTGQTIMSFTCDHRACHVVSVYGTMQALAKHVLQCLHSELLLGYDQALDLVTYHASFTGLGSH
jgi:hypothetical protein